MSDARHRKAYGTATAVAIVAAAVVASLWIWTNERWWKRSPPEGQVLVALRFPAEFVSEKDILQFSDLLAGAFSRHVAPVLRHESRLSRWPSYVGLRFLVSADQVADLERFADRSFEHFDNVFSHDGLLLVRGARGDVARTIRAYRAP